MKYVFFYVAAMINFIVLLLAILTAAMNYNTVDTQSRIGFIGLVLFFIALLVMTFKLKNAGRVILASLLLWIPAVPLIGYLGFAIIFIAASLAS